MTVKCVHDSEKAEIAQLYTSKLCSSDDLGKAYGVSKRTINRVLVEQGVNRVRAPSIRSQPTPVPVQAPAELPITMIEPEPQPFFFRIAQSVKGAFVQLFK